MEVHGPRNPDRPGSNRTESSHRASRRASKGITDDSSVGGDRVDVGESQWIDRQVLGIRRELDRRQAEVLARRDELLALAEDPTAIRRAASAILDAGLE